MELSGCGLNAHWSYEVLGARQREKQIMAWVRLRRRSETETEYPSLAPGVLTQGCHGVGKTLALQQQWWGGLEVMAIATQGTNLFV